MNYLPSIIESTSRSSLWRPNRILNALPKLRFINHPPHRFYSDRGSSLTLDDVLPSSPTPTNHPSSNEYLKKPSTLDLNMNASNQIKRSERFLNQPSSSSSSSSILNHFNRRSTMELASDPIRRRSGEKTHYSLIVRSTPNNTRLTLTHTPISYLPGSTDGNLSFKNGYPMAGSIVARTTAGSVGFKRGKRQEFEAATQATLSMFNKIRELINLPTLARLNSSPAKRDGIPRELEIVFDGFGVGRDAFIASLLNAQATDLREMVRSIRDTTTVKIGGPRPKKRRRV